MEIKVKQVPIAMTKSEVRAEYSLEDISELIRVDLEKHGYFGTVDIKFKTDYKNVSDSWGMNSTLVTIFKGATAIIDQEV